MVSAILAGTQSVGEGRLKKNLTNVPKWFICRIQSEGLNLFFFSFSIYIYTQRLIILFAATIFMYGALVI